MGWTERRVNLSERFILAFFAFFFFTLSCKLDCNVLAVAVPVERSFPCQTYLNATLQLTFRDDNVTLASSCASGPSAILPTRGRRGYALLVVEALSLHIEDLSLSGGAARKGGCLSITAQSVSIRNSMFESCSASFQGGAIWIGPLQSGTIFSVTIDDVVFAHNRLEANFSLPTIVDAFLVNSPPSTGSCLQDSSPAGADVHVQSCSSTAVAIAISNTVHSSTNISLFAEGLGTGVSWPGLLGPDPSLSSWWRNSVEGLEQEGAPVPVHLGAAVSVWIEGLVEASAANQSMLAIDLINVSVVDAVLSVEGASSLLPVPDAVFANVSLATAIGVTVGSNAPVSSSFTFATVSVKELTIANATGEGAVCFIGVAPGLEGGSLVEIGGGTWLTFIDVSSSNFFPSASAFTVLLSSSGAVLRVEGDLAITSSNINLVTPKFNPLAYGTMEGLSRGSNMFSVWTGNQGQRVDTSEGSLAFIQCLSVCSSSFWGATILAVVSSFWRATALRVSDVSFQLVNVGAEICAVEGVERPFLGITVFLVLIGSAEKELTVVNSTVVVENIAMDLDDALSFGVTPSTFSTILGLLGVGEVPSGPPEDRNLTVLDSSIVVKGNINLYNCSIGLNSTSQPGAQILSLILGSSFTAANMTIENSIVNAGNSSILLFRPQMRSDADSPSATPEQTIEQLLAIIVGFVGQSSVIFNETVASATGDLVIYNSGIVCGQIVIQEGLLLIGYLVGYNQAAWIGVGQLFSPIRSLTIVNSSVIINDILLTIIEARQKTVAPDSSVQVFMIGIGFSMKHVNSIFISDSWVTFIGSLIIDKCLLEATNVQGSSYLQIMFLTLGVTPTSASGLIEDSGAVFQPTSNVFIVDSFIQVANESLMTAGSRGLVAFSLATNLAPGAASEEGPGVRHVARNMSLLFLGSAVVYGCRAVGGVYESVVFKIDIIRGYVSQGGAQIELSAIGFGNSYSNSSGYRYWLVLSPSTRCYCVVVCLHFSPNSTSPKRTQNTLTTLSLSLSLFCFQPSLFSLSVFVSIDITSHLVIVTSLIGFVCVYFLISVFCYAFSFFFGYLNSFLQQYICNQIRRHARVFLGRGRRGVYSRVQRLLYQLHSSHSRSV